MISCSVLPLIGSFRPREHIAELRAYMRHRERLVEYAAAHVQHMQKALMQMNVQLHRPATITPSMCSRSGKRSSSMMSIRQDRGLLPAARVGKTKAVTATARKLAVLFYNLLKHGAAYQDPGAAFYEERYRQKVVRNLQRRAHELGYQLVESPAPGT